MIANSNGKRKTNKWPLALFYDYIDMSVMNTLTISYDIKLLKESNKRRENLIYLELSLIIDSVKRRSTVGLSTMIKNDIKETIDLFNKFKNQFSNNFSNFDVNDLNDDDLNANNLNANNLNTNNLNVNNLSENNLNESNLNEIDLNRKSYCFICLEQITKRKLRKVGYQCYFCKQSVYFNHISSFKKVNDKRRYECDRCASSNHNNL